MCSPTPSWSPNCLDLPTNSADFLNRGLGIHKVTVHIPNRVHLTPLPVRILPGVVLASQVQLHASFSRVVGLLVEARPRLVDLELATGTRVGESRTASAGCVVADGAVVRLCAVEEVAQLV